MNILTRRIREKNFMSNTMKENKMGTMPVNKLLINMALPMMISMLVQALYNIDDRIFVARKSEEALTADKEGMKKLIKWLCMVYS